MNIVIAQNDRPESRLAFDWVLNHGTAMASSPTDLHVHVVLVGGADSPASPNYSSPTLGESIAAELHGREVSHTVYAADSDAATQIIEVAESVSADLIVIGMRRRSATMKLLLGSQVQRVMLDALCPVVAIKPPLD
ncbi:universal stress protein [Rhodococcus sp. 077-4]|uniref:universal stress protein n=1 Tax=Rhodococcus sp. 077-4 TaxID=2789271 RepID=UPI0039F4905E